MKAPEETPPKYWAFLSYSHQDNLRVRADGTGGRIAWAEWLLEAIETYRPPPEFHERRTGTGEPMPERFFPLFQDEKELPLSGDLGQSIRQALGQSRYLIVICSPRSARSLYVNEEVRHFRALGRSDRILALIVAGEPNASLGHKPGVRAEEECFCPALRGTAAGEQEPIAGDVRLKSGGAVREAGQADFPAHRPVLAYMRLKLLAALMGVGFDELVQRDEARRRRRRRLIAAAASGFGAVLAGLSVFSTLSYFRASRAEAATRVALERSVELLRLTARNDVWEAHSLLRQGRDVRAFALLARALENDPASTAAVQTAIGALNTTLHRPATALLVGHGGPVQTAHFSPDGRLVVTASEDGTAAIWEASGGQPLHRLGGGGALRSAHFSPDGSRVLTAGADGQARLWETATGQAGRVLPHPGGLRRAIFSPDGTRVLTIAGDFQVQLWDVESGRRELELPAHAGTVYGVSFSPDGHWLATASNDKRARLWSATTGELRHTLEHKAAVHTASFSPDGARLVTASSDGRAQVWDVRSGAALALCEGHARSVLNATFSPDGTRLLTASDDATARLWESANGRLVASLGHDGPVKHARFSPDGLRLVTASDDGTARLWAASGQLLAIFSGHAAPVQNAHFHPDGSAIVTASTDGSARIWETGRTNFVSILGGHEGGVRQAGFTDSGRQVVTHSDDQTVRFWDASLGRCLESIPCHEDRLVAALWRNGQPLLAGTTRDGLVRLREGRRSEGVVTLARPAGVLPAAQFNADGRRLLTADADHVARLWGTADGQLLAALAGHTGHILGLAWSSDSALVATSAEDASARVWDASTGRLRRTFTGHDGPVGAAAFSPDGLLLATASEDRTARVWEIASGELRTVLRGHEGSVRSVRFSPDGARLVTAGTDRTARLWDRASGQLLGSLSGHAAAVVEGAFSADGSAVVTSSLDGTARVWLVPVQAGNAPPWFPMFLRWKVSARFDEAGVFRPETAAEQGLTRRRLEAALRAQSGSERASACARLAAWFLTPAAARPVHPWTAEATAQAADLLLQRGATAAEVARAYDFAPRHPLVHAALSPFEPAVERAEFLRAWNATDRPTGDETRAQRRRDLTSRQDHPPAPPGTVRNSLGQILVPIEGTAVRFARWPTRARDYARFAAETNRTWPQPTPPVPDTHPAVNVHWEDAVAFCAWLTQREQAAGRLSAQQRYRLPTDREWSAAAGLAVEPGETPAARRLAGREVYAWGTGYPPPRGAGNFDQRLRADDYETTSPVGAFGTDARGLCDLSGNVWQWCEDNYEPGSASRVLRGGSWADLTAESLRLTYRAYRAPLDRHANFGFRVVLAEE